MKSKSHTDPWLHPFYWEEVILLALSALAVAGIWWLLRDLVFPKQTPSMQVQPNLPPVAITIRIRAVAGEEIVVDVREYSYDPEGETPRILELGYPRFGAVEQIDDYHFRYVAPLRNQEIDSFPYQVVDESGVENQGWILVNVGAPASSRPAPLHATPDARDDPRRQATKPQQRPTETPPPTALSPRMQVESEEPLPTTPAASTPVAVTAPGLVPPPESGAIPETVTATPRAAPMPPRELHVVRQPVTMVPPPSASASPSPLDPGAEASKRPEIRGSMTKTDKKIKARKTAESRRPQRAVVTQKTKRKATAKKTTKPRRPKRAVATQKTKRKATAKKTAESRRPKRAVATQKTKSKATAKKTAEPRRPKRAVATQKKRESNPSNPSAWSPRYHGTK